MTDIKLIRDALRLRVTPAARLMLEQLCAATGPIDLVHRCAGEGGGLVAWLARGRARGGGLVEWAESGESMLFVRGSEVPRLHDLQLVLDVEFRLDRCRYDSAEARLVTLFRPHTETEEAMLGYVIGQEARREASGLIARLAPGR